MLFKLSFQSKIVDVSFAKHVRFAGTAYSGGFEDILNLKIKVGNPPADSTIGAAVQNGYIIEVDKSKTVNKQLVFKAVNEKAYTNAENAKFKLDSNGLTLFLTKLVKGRSTTEVEVGSVAVDISTKVNLHTDFALSTISSCNDFDTIITDLKDSKCCEFIDFLNINATDKTKIIDGNVAGNFSKEKANKLLDITEYNSYLVSKYKPATVVANLPHELNVLNEIYSLVGNPINGNDFKLDNGNIVKYAPSGSLDINSFSGDLTNGSKFLKNVFGLEKDHTTTTNIGFSIAPTALANGEKKILKIKGDSVSCPKVFKDFYDIKTAIKSVESKKTAAKLADDKIFTIPSFAPDYILYTDMYTAALNALKTNFAVKVNEAKTEAAKPYASATQSGFTIKFDPAKDGDVCLTNEVLGTPGTPALKKVATDTAGLFLNVAEIKTELEKSNIIIDDNGNFIPLVAPADAPTLAALKKAFEDADMDAGKLPAFEIDKNIVKLKSPSTALDKTVLTSNKILEYNYKIIEKVLSIKFKALVTPTPKPAPPPPPATDNAAIWKKIQNVFVTGGKAADGSGDAAVSDIAECSEDIYSYLTQPAANRTQVEINAFLKNAFAIEADKFDTTDKNKSRLELLSKIALFKDYDAKGSDDGKKISNKAQKAMADAIKGNLDCYSTKTKIAEVVTEFNKFTNDVKAVNDVPDFKTMAAKFPSYVVMSAFSQDFAAIKAGLKDVDLKKGLESGKILNIDVKKELVDAAGKLKAALPPAKDIKASELKTKIENVFVKGKDADDESKDLTHESLSKTLDMVYDYMSMPEAKRTVKNDPDVTAVNAFIKAMFKIEADKKIAKLDEARVKILTTLTKAKYEDAGKIDGTVINKAVKALYEDDIKKFKLEEKKTCEELATALRPKADSTKILDEGFEKITDKEEFSKLVVYVALGGKIADYNEKPEGVTKQKIADLINVFADGKVFGLDILSKEIKEEAAKIAFKKAEDDLGARTSETIDQLISSVKAKMASAKGDALKAAMGKITKKNTSSALTEAQQKNIGDLFVVVSQTIGNEKISSVGFAGLVAFVNNIIGDEGLRAYVTDIFASNDPEKVKQREEFIADLAKQLKDSPFSLGLTTNKLATVLRVVLYFLTCGIAFVIDKFTGTTGNKLFEKLPTNMRGWMDASKKSKLPGAASNGTSGENAGADPNPNPNPQPSPTPQV